MTDPRATQLRTGYDAVAEAYRAELFHELDGKPLDRAFLDAFAERCRGGRILEVGCGPGQVSAYLAGKGASVEGVDLSPRMVAVAQAATPTLDFQVADFFALPHPSGSLRGVVGFYAIVHLEPVELPRLFTELHRVLQPGGLLALAFHVGDERVHVDALFGQPTSLDFVHHAPEAVIGSLKAAGLTVEARLDRAPYPGAEFPSQRCNLLARR